MKNMKGKFIVIDGTNGSGKTEQTKLLVERMRSGRLPIETVSFPRYEKRSGGPVAEYLDHASEFGPMDEVGPKRASMLFAVDRYAASHAIRATLDAGTHVVANRYVASNMGHQGAQIADSKERAEFFRWNDELEHGFFGIPRPDLNIILHVPAEVTMKLIDKRGNAKDQHENLAHQKAAEATYLEMARTFPNFVLIECVRNEELLSIPDIHALVWKQVEHALALHPAP